MLLLFFGLKLFFVSRLRLIMLFLLVNWKLNEVMLIDDVLDVVLNVVDLFVLERFVVVLVVFVD